jgi:hypothetical protein
MIRTAGTHAGRISFVGVTMRSATRHCHSRHRRIGSTMSSRSSRRFGDPA